MIIMEQATALIILSELILFLQTAEVAMAICQDEKAVVERKMVMEKRFL